MTWTGQKNKTKPITSDVKCLIQKSTVEFFKDLQSDSTLGKTDNEIIIDFEHAF